MKPVILSVEQWKAIRKELHEEYPKTVFMIRDKMKRVLGFTVREHKAWIDKPDTAGDDLNVGYYQFQIHLDFYSENKRTMFLMKFSEIISNGKL
jgi:hypothetical protein